MGKETNIAWTDNTFNIVWGCVKVSPACQNCYADSLALRWGHNNWGPDVPRRTFGHKHWHEPEKWNLAAYESGEATKTFCSSMCDIFEDHPTVEAELKKLWPLIRNTPWIDWQLLTKRADRIVKCLPNDWGNGYPNVWLGVSIENNDYISRADHLKRIPAAVRFVSYEPALGPLDKLDLEGLDWVIYGGESGPGWRQHDFAWPRDMRDRCHAEAKAFFYKQSAGPRPGTGTTLDGEIIQEFPQPNRIAHKAFPDFREDCGKGELALS